MIHLDSYCYNYSMLKTMNSALYNWVLVKCMTCIVHGSKCHKYMDREKILTTNIQTCIFVRFSNYTRTWPNWLLCKIHVIMDREIKFVSFSPSEIHTTCTLIWSLSTLQFCVWLHYSYKLAWNLSNSAPSSIIGESDITNKAGVY